MCDFMKVVKTILLFLSIHAYGQQDRYDTTLLNNKLPFKINVKTSKNTFLLTSTSKGKVTVIDTIDFEEVAYIKYPDFDNDGNKDILIDYYGNNSTYFLYLFDKSRNKFIKIDNYMSFPDAMQLTSNRKYYYSYHRAGCADMNWVSDLFKIQDFKIVHIGSIYGNGCDFEVETNPQVIEIYKVLKNDESNKKLLVALPYLEYINENSEKWTFAGKYWNENYTKFE